MHAKELEQLRVGGKYICTECGTTNTEIQKENDIIWVSCKDCGNLNSHFDETKEY